MAWIRLNQLEYFHNLAIIAERTGGMANLSVVLKDNAYGHGLVEMATLARSAGVQEAVVRTLDEARAISSLFSRILVLCDIPDQIEPYSFAINSLTQLASMPPQSQIELKVDSGMHRNGILEEELDLAFKMAHEKGCEVVGVMTHFRAGDDLTPELFWQRERFDAIKRRSDRLSQEFRQKEVRYHACSSSALFRGALRAGECARVGIATYGYLEWDHAFGDAPLRPVLSLHARVIASRTLQKGARIGYGGAWEMEESGVVGSYDIGYGDGFPRIAEGHGPLLLPSGRKLLPRVSMDYSTILEESAEVCLFHDATALARHVGTITYVITTQLSHALKREVV